MTRYVKKITFTLDRGLSHLMVSVPALNKSIREDPYPCRQRYYAAQTCRLLLFSLRDDANDTVKRGNKHLGSGVSLTCWS
jgi:hypothetical protein